MGEAGRGLPTQPNTMFFSINIGRQLGSGGRAIGKLLAEEFGIAYYDKEILTLAAKESGMAEELFTRGDEHKGFLRAIMNQVGPFFAHGGGDYYSNYISGDNLFRYQSEAILRAAEEQSCVFIGRCADYVLREKKEVVNVFIVADRADRLRRVCDFHGIDEKAAEKLIAHGDSERASFYNFYNSHGRWGEAATYDLCVNSSVLGIEGTAGLIADFVRKKLNLPASAQ